MWKELLRRPPRAYFSKFISRKTCLWNIFFLMRSLVNDEFSFLLRGRLLLLLIMSRLVLGCKICAWMPLNSKKQKRVNVARARGGRRRTFDNSACFHHRSRTNRNGSKSFAIQSPIFIFNFFLLRIFREKRFFLLFSYANYTARGDG